MNLIEWAQRWGVPHAALIELALLPAGPEAPLTEGSRPEAFVQRDVRVEAAQKGIALFRNNVGAGKLASGNFVRFGLGNDSPAVNAVVKSGDLIGLRPVLITPAHVGTIVGQFVSRECKREAWQFNPVDERDAAQLRWATFINARGGDAAFVQKVGTL